jgi:hypothetical protein
MSDHNPVLKDERTRVALRDLANKQKAAIDAAGEICNCVNRQQARAKKQMSQCDKDRLLQYLPGKIIGDKSHFTQVILGKTVLLTAVRS